MQPESQDDDVMLRQRLLKRVTIAGAVVVVLLAGLALFDGLYVRVEPPKEVAIAEPPPKPIEPTTTETATDTAKAADGPEGKAPDQGAAAKEPVAEPEHTAEPTGTLPPAAHSERPLTALATARPAMLQPSDTTLARRSPEADKDIAKPSPASRPIARAVEAAGQFLLQMGVFSNVVNAEELRAKLELAGVPAQIEARVQVGPFATRQEAEHAREKLKSLGMEPGLVVAAHK